MRQFTAHRFNPDDDEALRYFCCWPLEGPFILAVVPNLQHRCEVLPTCFVEPRLNHCCREEALQTLLLSSHVLSTIPPVADFNRDPVRADRA